MELWKAGSPLGRISTLLTSIFPVSLCTYNENTLIIVMALVTYTLLSALASGLQSRFHPEVLGYSLSKAMLVVVGEFCAIKLGCYLLDVRGSGASGVELIGYGGYKFVGYVMNPPFPSLIFFMSI